MTIRGVGGGTPIFSYIVRSIIFGSKFQKSNNFWSMKICGYFFFFFFLRGRGGHYEIGLFFLGGGGGGGVQMLISIETHTT